MIGAWLVGLGVVACDEPPPTTPPSVLSAGEVDYVLSVDWSGATLVDEHYEFETDLGYTVGISRWSQSVTSIELVVCDEFRAHPGYTPDVSQLSIEVVQELTHDEPLALGPAPADGRPYCELYEILGAIPHGDDDDVALVSEIFGWYRAAGSSEVIDFEGRNTVPISVLPRVLEGEWDDQLRPDVAVVDVRRFPARALDGLELSTLSELDLGFEAAEQLGQGAEVTWRLGWPG